MAYWRRKPSPGLLHHSDRGSQYAGHDYQNGLNQYGMTASMSRKGNCWDNAPTERFFRSLKSERLDSCRFQPEKRKLKYLITLPSTTACVSTRRWVTLVPSNMKKNDYEMLLKRVFVFS